MTSPDRKRDFKPTVDPSNSQRKRMDDTMQSRASKKAEAVMKRRRVGENPQPTMTVAIAGTQAPRTPLTIAQASQILDAPNCSTKLLGDALCDFRDVFSTDEIVQHPEAIHVLLKRLVLYSVDQETNPLAVSILEIILQVLARIVICEDNAEAADAMYRLHGIEKVAPLIEHGRVNVRNHALVVLERLASHSATCRATILAQPKLLDYLIQNNLPQGSTQDNALQLAATLCEGNTSFDLVSPLIGPLGWLLLRNYHGISFEGKLAIVSAFSHLSENGSVEQIQAVMDTDTTSVIANFLNNEDKRIVKASLDCLVNFTTGTAEQTRKVVNATNVLSRIRRIVDSAGALCSDTSGPNRQYFVQRALITKALRVLRNVSQRSSSHHIAALLQPHGGESESILQALVKAGDFEVDRHVRIPALRVLTNICCYGTENEVRQVYLGSGLGPLTQALGLREGCVAVLNVALDALKRIFEVSRGHLEASKVVQVFDEYDGKDKLEELLHNERINSTQEDKAHALWDLYALEHDGLDHSNDVVLDEDENISPSRDMSGLHSFSSPPVKRLDFGSSNLNNRRSPDQDRPRNFGDQNRGLY